MISAAWEPSAAGPLRRTYTVEPPGRELLRSWADFLEQRGDTFHADDLLNCGACQYDL